MKIKLYNSNTKSKELFVPIDPKKVTMYVCGPTVYSYPHIGNARGPVIFDVLARLLRREFDLKYVRNITDLDDKIYQAAHDEGIHISEVTQRYTRIYQEDMSALGVEKPDLEPLATEHIPEMIEMIEGLIIKGHAYENQGHVFFQCRDF
jgi:cysteinyl-tRNA synthetase